MIVNWLSTPWSWTSLADLAVAASVPILLWAAGYCYFRAFLVATGKHRSR